MSNSDIYRTIGRSADRPSPSTAPRRNQTHRAFAFG